MNGQEIQPPHSKYDAPGTVDPSGIPLGMASLAWLRHLARRQHQLLTLIRADSRWEWPVAAHSFSVSPMANTLVDPPTG